MNGIPSNLAVRTAAGAVGGMTGALLRKRALEASRRLPRPLQPVRPRRDPDAFLVAKLARGRPLPGELRQALVLGLRAGYGAATGALLALLTRRPGLRTPASVLLGGAALGTLAWAAAYAGWMPRARLVPPLRRQGLVHGIASALGFAASGVVAAIPVLLLDRRTRSAPAAHLPRRRADHA